MINLNSDGQGHFKRLQTPVKQGSNDPTNGLQSPPERGTNDYERPSHTPPIPPIGEGGFGLRADRFEPNKSSHYKHPDNGFVTHHRMFVMSAAGGHEHRERFVCRRHKHASQGQRRCFYTAPSVGLCDSFRYCELAGGGCFFEDKSVRESVSGKAFNGAFWFRTPASARPNCSATISNIADGSQDRLQRRIGSSQSKRGRWWQMTSANCRNCARSPYDWVRTACGSPPQWIA